jgi:drug/metabolite transporter (DMT)-like permease
MLGYIDPIVSIAVSVAFFSEPLSPWALVGALLIIGASAGSELLSFREQNNKRETKNEN